jgi:hypothetical protein
MTSTGRHLIHDTVRATTTSGHVIALTVYSTHVSIITFAGRNTIDDWTANLPATTPTQRQAACAEASRARDLFNRHGGPDGVAHLRNLLAIERGPLADRLDRSRDPHARRVYAQRVDDIDSRMAQLEDLGTKRVRAALAQQFAHAA